MNTLPPWLVPGADVFLGRTYGTVETIKADTSLVLAFARGRYITRRYLSPVEVRALLETEDLRAHKRSS